MHLLVRPPTQHEVGMNWHEAMLGGAILEGGAQGMLMGADTVTHKHTHTHTDRQTQTNTQTYAKSKRHKQTD